ncbi:hypothetical protein A0H81_14809 [Grifola frondosa]|uniref:ArsA/GET3 Anion-transporting ATPase-like domain-containing protein n=1 Tax=Grifola frondosa TaxID=5627 RepID=A0A1C7LKZ0_GRIFR|nr:hypothetical protein A0H81_14809 [Grifola frondosa]
MECSGIVFDTAPTGHTLHFLSSPTVLSEKALGKLSILSRRIGPMINQVGAGADTVVEENTHGASDLPIIEFADLDRHHIDHPLPPPARARKPHKIHKRPAPSRALSEPPSAPPVPSSEHEEECLLLMSLSPLRCKSRWDLFFQIGSGGNLLVRHTRTPRDVPFLHSMVGEFWGHDDRLLHKDLCRLSGWWRGHWQTRGHGRGTFGMCGRGYPRALTANTVGYGTTCSKST